MADGFAVGSQLGPRGPGDAVHFARLRHVAVHRARRRCVDPGRGASPELRRSSGAAVLSGGVRHGAGHRSVHGGDGRRGIHWIGRSPRGSAAVGPSTQPHPVSGRAERSAAAAVRRRCNPLDSRGNRTKAWRVDQSDWDALFLLARRAAAQDGAVITRRRILVTQHVVTEKADKILTLTLNRPDKKNALTRAMYQTLATEIANAESDPDVRCILIMANGDMFTAGNDLADFAAVGNAAGAPKPEDANPLLPALARARTPIVAAVNGRAVGVGVTMLLHCDMVYVADDALLSTPFVNLALVPEAGSSLLMPLRIGHVRAFEMFVLGEPVNAEKAVNWGIANRSVPQAVLHSTARAAAIAIAARAPASVVATKTLMRDEGVLLARMSQESGHFIRQLKSADFKEAFTAFSERRAPDFSRFE